MKTIFQGVILCIIYGLTFTAVSCTDDDENAPAYSTPIDITYGNLSSSSFTVTWSASPNATGYIVKIKDEWGELTDKIQTVTEPTATFTGLESEKKYWVAVGATYNNESASPFSAWKALRMPEGSIAKQFAAGAGIANLPFIIKTAGQLKLMAYLVNKTNEIKNEEETAQIQEEGIEMDPTIDYTKAYYELGSDIDMGEIRDWTPIGTGADNMNISMLEKNTFDGHFDGKGHTIYNFNTNYKDDSPIILYGLFGLSDNGCTISNLNLEGNITVTHTGTKLEQNYLVIGGILAYAQGTTINNCTFKGNIHASFETNTQGYGIAGGIVGSLSSSIINQCIVTLPTSSQFVIYSAHPQIGAIAGFGNSGTIQYCTANIDGKILAETKPLDEYNTLDYTGVSAMAGGICATSQGTSIGICNVTVNGSIHAKSIRNAPDGIIRTMANAGGISGYFGADALTTCNILVKGSIIAEADNAANAAGAVGSQTQAGYGANALHVIVSGEISAISNPLSQPESNDAAYAGGIYGNGSFQMGNVLDADVIIQGKITAKHPQMAMAGGIAGSIMGPIRCWTMIEPNGTLEALGGTAGASCGGITGNLSKGNIAACYTVCKGTMAARSETATSRSPVTTGGIVGVASGNRMMKKSIIGCYSLLEGTVTATGAAAFTGGIAGMNNTYATLNTTYWWSSSDAIKGHSGAMGISDLYKMTDNSQSSLEAAAQELNTMLDNYGYGYFFYREKEKCLNITNRLQ